MFTESWDSRTLLMLGEERLRKLKKAHVLVAGLGGVGAYAAEMLCRAGVGEITMFDGDTVSVTNRNRQLPALVSTIGLSKAELMKERLLDINPDVKVNAIDKYFKDDELIQIIEAAPYDYVVDAIDTLSPKVYLIYFSLQNNLKLVSSMGAGGKLDPSYIRVADIAETHQCKLALFIRKRLHKLGVRTGFNAVFSSEVVPKECIKMNEVQEQNKLTTVGTISYMPAMFGCFAASVVIRDLVSS
jgi:tRNA A37 threonylcarbamoyladenosine dehydratase